MDQALKLGHALSQRIFAQHQQVGAQISLVLDYLGSHVVHHVPLFAYRTLSLFNLRHDVCHLTIDLLYGVRIILGFFSRCRSKPLLWQHMEPLGAVQLLLLLGPHFSL